MKWSWENILLSLVLLQASSYAVREGIQVIVPEMKFGCTGRITGWTAHTTVFTHERFIEELTHVITFQVWRPSDSTASSYNLVGSNTLHFSGTELGDGITDMSTTDYHSAFFSFSNKNVSHENEIYFRPGDVLGWYISSQVRTISPPLRPLYRSPLRNESSLLVTMFAHAATNQESTLCSVKETFQAYNSILPMVAVTYQVGQEQTFSDTNRACNSTTTGGHTEKITPTDTLVSSGNAAIAATTNAASTKVSSSTCNSPQQREIQTTDIVFLVVMVATLILHVVMIVFCALNLSTMRGVRKSMKSNVMMPTSPRMHLPTIFKQPTVSPSKPAKYEMVNSLANYEMIAPKSNYETVDGSEKHDGSKDSNAHLRMLQPEYDPDSSPELQRSNTHKSINGSKDALMDHGYRK